MQTSVGMVGPPIKPQEREFFSDPRPLLTVRQRTSRESSRTCVHFWRGLFSCAAVVTFVLGIASGTEHGASVYPAGIETVFPGFTPNPGGTMLYEYTAYYVANEFDDSQGKSSIPKFKLNAFAVAVKVVHNWNLHALGGTLNSYIAVPFIDEQLHLPIGKFSKFSLSNVSIGLMQVGYKKGNWHWLYEADIFLPGGAYSKYDVLNVGQHNFAVAPAGAFTYLPFHSKTEISSKLQYIINAENTDSGYYSGNEFTWEYDAMQEISKKLAVGVNGYLYQQTTDDKQLGAIISNGFRGRDLAVGPQLRFKLGAHSGFAVKYQRDTWVQNKPRGNAFWFQIGVPLSSGKFAKP
jgi:hypothetical protein